MFSYGTLNNPGLNICGLAPFSTKHTVVPTLGLQYNKGPLTTHAWTQEWPIRITMRGRPWPYTQTLFPLRLLSGVGGA